MKNIILCGFMGSGKSSAGTALAKLLNLEFIDMDDYIEEREKMKIPDIFEAFGEEYFRGRERAAVLELSGMGGLVIASGGGALTRQENVEVFQKDGEIIFLNASFDDCYKRIEKSDRPLVKRNSREQLEGLYSGRASAYRRAAKIEIDASGSPADIAEAIALRLNRH